MVSNGVSTLMVEILMVLMVSSGNTLMVSNGSGYPNGNIPMVWWCLMVLYGFGGKCTLAFLIQVGTPYWLI